MKQDMYTKVVLTAIASLLMILVIQTHLGGTVERDVTPSNLLVNVSNQPLAVDIVSVGGKEITADYMEAVYYGGNVLPVRIVK